MCRHAGARCLLALALLLLSSSTAHGALHAYPRVTVSAGGADGGDPGLPLFLTPLLEAGNATLARQLARVPLTDALHVESYAGFFTVNASLGANQFFWYFPPLSAPPADAPVLLWLQGGPGASSLYGLFAEHGPVRVRRGRLERRKYTWALDHHVIYVDNPVGTGFSFTRDPRGYVRTEEEVGRDLYATLRQFFQLFPQLRANRFFVTGESYAGKYVPAVAYAVHTRNAAAVPAERINLAGLAIGNGLTDPGNQLAYGDYLYQHGLLDTNQRAVFQTHEALVSQYIQAQQWESAFNAFDTLLNGDLIEGKSLFYNMTGYQYYFNYLRTHDNNASDGWAKLLGSSETRRALHVGPLPFNDGRLVEQHLVADVMQSVAPWLSELLAHYQVLVYSGQLDIIVAYPLTENYLKRLVFPGAARYRTAPRHMWHVDGELAGYEKHGGNLTEVLVRNAGHMVPADQPRWAQDLITRFTHHPTSH